MDELTITETQTLGSCESVIDAGLKTFVDVGNALAKIRESKLYRKTHGTFEDYCQDRWGIARRTAYQMIDAATVVNNVRDSAQMPTRETHARPLTQFNDEPELQNEIWETAVHTAPNGKITAKHVQSVVDEYKNPLTASNHNVSQSPDYDGDEWFTPSKFIDMARDVMGTIDLDPASCEAAQAEHGITYIFTKENNGLDRKWFGNVFVNPPYSVNLIKAFVSKCISEYESGNADQIILLTNNSSETNWFQSMLGSYPVCFPSSRISFWRPNHDAFGTRQGQAFFYFGENVTKFNSVFSSIGCVVMAL